MFIKSIQVIFIKMGYFYACSESWEDFHLLATKTRVTSFNLTVLNSTLILLYNAYESYEPKLFLQSKKEPFS